MSLPFTHVDVFADEPYRGNSLPVFVEPGPLSAVQLLQITQELRHFEAIFLEPTADPSTWRVRVFDMFAELAFAGHPLIGAAAVLHQAAANPEPMTWRLELPSRAVSVITRHNGDGFVAELDQGAPEFLGAAGSRLDIAQAFSLEVTDLRDDLPIEVVSTGLRYLIVPVRPGALGRARVAHDLTELVESTGAEFAVLFDEARPEIRHWNNDGVVEDVATGSAAGTIGAYRLRHGLTPGGQAFPLHQGQFVGRPSVLTVRPEGESEHVRSVFVGGPVAFVGRGVVAVPA